MMRSRILPGLAFGATMLSLSLPSRALTVNIGPSNSIGAAISQVAAAGGGTVNLAAGTYVIYGTTEITSNITLNGAGEGKTILMGLSSPYTFPMLEASGNGIYNILIENMTINGNCPKSQAAVSNGYVGQIGIHFICPTSNASGNFTVSNVEVENCSLGLGGGNIDGLTVNGCKVHDNGMWVASGLWQHNLYFDACSYVNIEYSSLYNSWEGDGIHLDITNNLVGTNWTVQHCNIYGNAEEGIMVQNNANNVDILNNTITDNGFGAVYDTNYYAQDGLQLNGGSNCVVSGNTVDNNKDYGIRVLSGSGSVTNNTATGNANNYWILNTYTTSGNN